VSQFLISKFGIISTVSKFLGVSPYLWLSESSSNLHNITEILIFCCKIISQNVRRLISIGPWVAINFLWSIWNLGFVKSEKNVWDKFSRSLRFSSKLSVLAKISMFYQNFDSWPKFRFLTKISIFDQILNIIPKSSKIFEQNYHFFCQNFNALPKFLDRNFDFWSKFKSFKNFDFRAKFFLAKISMFYQNFASWVKNLESRILSQESWPKFRFLTNIFWLKFRFLTNIFWLKFRLLTKV